MYGSRVRACWDSVELVWCSMGRMYYGGYWLVCLGGLHHLLVDLLFHCLVFMCVYYLNCEFVRGPCYIYG